MNEKLFSIIDQLKKLTLLEASQLVKEIEITFGIDASSSFTTPIIGTNIDTISPLEKVEEKILFDIILQEVSATKKIAVLKVVRNITGLGLKESKDIVDNVPKLIKEGLSKEESEKIKKEFEEAGGVIIIK